MSVNNVRLLDLTLVFINKLNSAKAIVSKLKKPSGLLKAGSGNFLVCPMSVEVILALLKTGTKGETANQIAAAVHLPRSQERTIQAFSFLVPSLQGTDKYTLHSSNKIFVKDGFKISEEYKDIAVKVFGADLQNVNFENNQQAASEANKWVEGKTLNKLKGVVNPNSLDEDTRLVLINAMYYEGKWNTKFGNYTIKPMPFFLTSKNHVEMNMIEVAQNFYYYENSDIKAKFLQLPYEGDDVTMTIVLPNDTDGLTALEENIAEVLLPHKFTSEEVHIRIPIYKITTTINFNDILKSLGMVLPFQNGADFSTIVGESKADALKINEIVQKTFIELDTKGTSTEAATISVHNLKNIGIVTPKTFYADHPFIFCLRHTIIGTFFIGRYTGVMKEA